MSAESTMRLLLLLLCSTLLAPAVLAQEADLEVTSVTIDKTTLATGELFSFTARVRNNGPAIARDVLVRFSDELPLTIEAPAGWTCRRYVSDSPGGTCAATTLAVGAEAEFRGTLLAPRNTGIQGRGLYVIATSRVTDPVQANSNGIARFNHVAAASQADLAAKVTPRGGTREGAQATLDVEITNHGPAAAHNVVVAVDTRDEHPLINPSAEGSGWTCATNLQGILCRTATIAAGATPAFVVRFTAPDNEAVISVAALPQAEMSIDSGWRNDLGLGHAGIGSAENWRRILLPLTATSIPGANGAEWRTDIAMLIRSDESVQIWPGPCDQMVDPCYPAPLQSPFDPGIFINRWTLAPGGHFLYARPGDEKKLHFNARIYDAARMVETAGAEIPIVREEEFRTSTISLLGIPVAPQYRHTLRVYDADARANARVIVHVYAGEESAPRVSTVRSFERSPDSRPLTNAMLPSHPGYLELRLDHLGSLEGLGTVRVDVEPVDPGLRFWAFVSITNNETHHVTTVTPQ